MEKVGAVLQRARQQQGISLDELACRTKISRTVLAAIEEHNQQLLPPPAYMRGFLRVCAQELDLCADDLIAHFEQDAPEVGKWQAQRELQTAAPAHRRVKAVCRLFALLVLLVAALALLRAYRTRPETPALGIRPQAGQRVAMPDNRTAAGALMSRAHDADNASIEQAAQDNASARIPAVVMGLDNASGVADNALSGVFVDASDPVVLMFRAEQLAWVWLRADNESAYDITLYPGQVYRKQAQHALQVRIGNPAGVDLTYNGMPVDLPDTPGVPVDLSFPRIEE